MLWVSRICWGVLYRDKKISTESKLTIKDYFNKGIPSTQTGGHKRTIKIYSRMNAPGKEWKNTLILSHAVYCVNKQNI